MIQRAGIEEIYDPAIGYVVRAKRARQKNNGLGGAGNTVIRGLATTSNLKGVVMVDAKSTLETSPRFRGVFDPDHPIFTPRPEKVESEEWWEYKWRLEVWNRKVSKRPAMTNSMRKKVFTRDKYQCVKCGAREPLAVDHIYPWSKGGSHTIENYETLCTPCNNAKSDSIEWVA